MSKKGHNDPQHDHLQCPVFTTGLPSAWSCCCRIGDRNSCDRSTGRNGMCAGDVGCAAATATAPMAPPALAEDAVLVMGARGVVRGVVPPDGLDLIFTKCAWLKMCGTGCGALAADRGTGLWCRCC